MDEHDNLLKETIAFLQARWFEPDVGIVAACLADGEKKAIATSLRGDDGRWLHAERRAIEEFTANYGSPSFEAIMIVTLSPCVSPQSKTRDGPPCATLLIRQGITQVHFGSLDTNQASMEKYRSLWLRVSQTEDPLLRNICRNLALLLKTYANRHLAVRLGNPWIAIKEEIGFQPFEP